LGQYLLRRQAFKRGYQNRRQAGSQLSQEKVGEEKVVEKAGEKSSPEITADFRRE
jgi:hypothetical protein